MAYVPGFYPPATKRQKEFLRKYGITFRNNIRKGEATVRIGHVTRDWTEARMIEEDVHNLHLTEDKILKASLSHINNTYNPPVSQVKIGDTISCTRLRISGIVVGIAGSGDVTVSTSQGVVSVRLEEVRHVPV